MYFTHKVWHFPLAASLVGAFLLFVMVAIVVIPTAFAPTYPMEGVLLFIASAAMEIVFLRVYIAWVQKYLYFFRLRRLLNDKITSAAHVIGHITASGVLFTATGIAPTFSIIESPQDSDIWVSYTFNEYGLRATSGTKRTTILIHGADFTEHEQVHTERVGLDQRKAFERLLTVLQNANPV